MGERFHGVTSIGLVMIAVGVAAVAALQDSVVLAGVYLTGCLVGAAGIVYAYCAKCPCRLDCAHVVFGRLAVVFADREPGPYTGNEVAVVVVALVWLLGLPQVWLWRTPVALGIFWVLNAVALTQIRAAVCPGCDNRDCPLKAGN